MAEPALNSVAFPILNETHLAALGQCHEVSCERYPDGATLIEVGDSDFKFFVVRRGGIEILDVSGDVPRTVVVHGPGAFTGDVGHLTGNPAVVRAVARDGCEAYVMSAAALRQLLNHSPQLGDILLQAFIARRQLLHESPDFTGLRVIGSGYSRDTFRIRDFLAKNHVLFTWFDVESDPDVAQLLKAFAVTEAETPVIACGQMLLLRNPSNREIADAVGIRKPVEKSVHDLVVIGAGPAGLAAAVYGASEGLSTAVLEHVAPGGQAGSSMRIENYLGFPTGITGSELADRAVLQASKFGARLSVSTAVRALTFDGALTVVHLEDGDTVAAKCLLIATGAEYRRLDVEDCERFEGCGVYYAATPNEAQQCVGRDVAVVGGGNSAGQAAVFLSGHARRVFLLLRGDDLYKNMSSYLAHRIEQTANIEILRQTTVQRMHGNGHLDAVDVMDQARRAERTLEIPMLFSFIGATPRTEWLPEAVETDARGFVRTGSAAARSPLWSRPRPPFLLETTRPGVFAAGDVRAGSVKRVASAVGEGAMAVQFVHAYLNEV